jgi:hypothetical protein
MSPKPSTLAPHDAANQHFHDTYCAAREDVRRDGPIMVVLAREIVLLRQEQRRAYHYSRPFFDAAKSAAHVAVMLFTLTSEQPLGPTARSRVEALNRHVVRTLDAFQGSSSAESWASIEPVLAACLRFSDHALRTVGASRDSFAAEVGPEIVRLTERATCEQIASLHTAVETALAELAQSQRQALQVVVVGDHQARSLSLGMQYFQRRFGEADGSDKQVTYGENLTTENEALELVGTRRLDRTIARAFFGDETRLQRDVLGDAAAKCLNDMKLTRIC